MDALWHVFLIAAAGVAAIVYGLIVWSLVRYRRCRAGLPPQFREHVPLEILYTAIPILIVAVLFALTYRAERAVESLPPGPALTINVRAFQWSWRFEYEGEGITIVGGPDRPPVLVLPIGRRIRFVVTSADVIHSFYIPGFRFKRDAIPGMTNQFEITLTETGVYRGQCAEFCGLDHAYHRFTIRAVGPNEFQQWLTRSRTQASR